MPSGVTSLDVIAYGARGGAGVAGQHGGAGTPARVATTLPVTPRETLYIVVGGRGADSDSSSRDGCGNYKCLFAAGGWGGGGASGPIPDVGQPAPLSGGGGGGASDVRTKPMG